MQMLTRGPSATWSCLSLADPSFLNAGQQKLLAAQVAPTVDLDMATKLYCMTLYFPLIHQAGLTDVV